jgi:Flp pilus assembly protein TadG
MPLRPPAAASRVRGRRSSHGQSLVEAAVTLPLVLLLALGVIDIGRAFYYREAVTNATRQALRVAVSQNQQATANAICASAGAGPIAVTTTSPITPATASIATIVNQAALESSSNGTPAGSAINGGTISVTFHCLAGAAVTNASGNGNGPSDPGSDAVSVTINYSFAVITPLLWPVIGTTFPITVTSAERAEY